MRLVYLFCLIFVFSFPSLLHFFCYCFFFFVDLIVVAVVHIHSLLFCEFCCLFFRTYSWCLHIRHAQKKSLIIAILFLDIHMKIAFEMKKNEEEEEERKNQFNGVRARFNLGNTLLFTLSGAHSLVSETENVCELNSACTRDFVVLHWFSFSLLSSAKFTWHIARLRRLFSHPLEKITDYVFV